MANGTKRFIVSLAALYMAMSTNAFSAFTFWSLSIMASTVANTIILDEEKNGAKMAARAEEAV